MSDRYQDVIQANIAVHSKVAAVYSTTEPHFRPENLAVVESVLKRLVAETRATSLLDLGCGTGFMINLAKRHVARIVGIDVTRAMLDQVDTSGPARIELHEHDTGSFHVEPGSFDLVTAYSFLHHLYDIRPTLATAARALRKGGRFYVDLEPNFHFWEAISRLPTGAGAPSYDPLVTREIDAVVHKDDQMNETFGIPNTVFNDAEYGKNIAGGFQEDALRDALREVGFSDVTFTYYWYLGQALLVNDKSKSRDQCLADAALVDALLQKVMPLSRHLYKYIGFVAIR
ncbi:MAG TPA: class I SAM-dependent methyltransferase [Kofleriaceae bacterium]